jgi:hypothetical protein
MKLIAVGADVGTSRSIGRASSADNSTMHVGFRNLSLVIAAPVTCTPTVVHGQSDRKNPTDTFGCRKIPARRT